MKDNPTTQKPFIIMILEYLAAKHPEVSHWGAQDIYDARENAVKFYSEKAQEQGADEMLEPILNKHGFTTETWQEVLNNISNLNPPSPAVNACNDEVKAYMEENFNLPPLSILALPKSIWSREFDNLTEGNYPGLSWVLPEVEEPCLLFHLDRGVINGN